MKAVAWHGVEDMRVDEVADPVIQQPTDAIVRVTSTAICGSDLHLYKPLGMWLEEGDIVGHEPITHVPANCGTQEPFCPQAAGQRRHRSKCVRLAVALRVLCGLGLSLIPSPTVAPPQTKGSNASTA